MSLVDRLGNRKPPTNPPPGGGKPTPKDNAAVDPPVRPSMATPTRLPTLFNRPGPDGGLSAVDRLKVEIHHKLIDRLDLEALERMDNEKDVEAQIRLAVTEFLRAESTPLSQAERDEIIEHIVWEVTGLGPIEPFFRDPTITDILVNNARNIFIERRGQLMRVGAQFRNDAHLMAVIDRIVSRVGRRVDESSPMVDARLPDGSRVNAIIPPLALDGPVLSIRRFGADITGQQLVEYGSITQEILDLLAGCVKARLNILISGGTGSGKTTLLNILSSYIPSTERLISIEDAAELRLQQEHVVRLETRPPNAEGRGEVIPRDLVKNALRMRPDRIIVGEVRGSEALDMMQAMNTGHEGSLSTVHANSSRDALARLETMVLMAGTSLPNRAMREQIASALDVIIQIQRFPDGSRRVVTVTEVTGMEGDIVTTQDIFRYRRRGIGADGRVIGQFESSGVRPVFMERLKVSGVELPTGLFV